MNTQDSSNKVTRLQPQLRMVSDDEPKVELYNQSPNALQLELLPPVQPDMFAPEQKSFF